MTADPPRRRRLSATDYVAGVLARDRVVLGRAITLIESSAPGHEDLARQVLDRLVPHSGQASRVGITGAPGVGKSTLIEALGLHLVAGGRRVAVLAVDPTSRVSQGSILGDKTRMPALSREESAFIRPSPASGSLGGVARKTREAMLLCEAAGHDVVLVETVGVGQSEDAVRSMVDFFLLLIMPGAGDELQGIKRGIVEMADALAVTRADGQGERAAERSRADYAAALHLLPPDDQGWQVQVLACSALTGRGIDELWRIVKQHREHALRTGQLVERRRRQSLQWMHSLIQEGLQRQLLQTPAMRALLARLEREVGEGTLAPTSAAMQVLSALGTDAR